MFPEQKKGEPPPAATFSARAMQGRSIAAPSPVVEMTCR